VESDDAKAAPVQVRITGHTFLGDVHVRSDHP
jgi:hypothetical protein